MPVQKVEAGCWVSNVHLDCNCFPALLLNVLDNPFGFLLVLLESDNNFTPDIPELSTHSFTNPPRTPCHNANPTQGPLLLRPARWLVAWSITFYPRSTFYAGFNFLPLAS